MPTDPLEQLRRLYQLWREEKLFTFEAAYLAISIIKYAVELLAKNLPPDQIWSETNEGEFLSVAHEFLAEVNGDDPVATGILGNWVLQALVRMLIELLMEPTSEDGGPGMLGSLLAGIQE